MIPDVLVDREMKRAREIARELTAQVNAETGCHAVAVVAEMREGKGCSSMAVDPALDAEPEQELALMRCALTRVLSLIVLHAGPRTAMAYCMESLSHAARLADEVRSHTDDPAG